MAKSLRLALHGFPKLLVLLEGCCRKAQRHIDAFSVIILSKPTRQFFFLLAFPHFHRLCTRHSRYVHLPAFCSVACSLPKLLFAQRRSWTVCFTTEPPPTCRAPIPM